jgi:hypothetical protein
MFAKLYETEIGQVLVKKDEGDEGPEVRFFFTHEGFGVCSVAIEFSDDEAGWEKCDIAFEKVDEEMATSVASNTIHEFMSTLG